MSGLVELRARMFRMCCSNESWANPRSGELADPSSAPAREHNKGGDGGRMELLHGGTGIKNNLSCEVSRWVYYFFSLLQNKTLGGEQRETWVLQQRKQETLVSAGDADHCGTKRQIRHDPETTDRSWGTTHTHRF